mmetsp:Transcript_57314/g.166337  ORF Transcript_57314/g.166337 Transcript_57314/m.166337 type:complete len:346 (-) Transcript_57314:363-1400(-)
MPKAAVGDGSAEFRAAVRARLDCYLAGSGGRDDSDANSDLIDGDSSSEELDDSGGNSVAAPSGAAVMKPWASTEQTPTESVEPIARRKSQTESVITSAANFWRRKSVLPGRKVKQKQDPKSKIEQSASLPCDEQQHKFFDLAASPRKSMDAGATTSPPASLVDRTGAALPSPPKASQQPSSARSAWEMSPARGRQKTRKLSENLTQSGEKDDVVAMARRLSRSSHINGNALQPANVQPLLPRKLVQEPHGQRQRADKAGSRGLSLSLPQAADVQSSPSRSVGASRRRGSDFAGELPFTASASDSMRECAKMRPAGFGGRARGERGGLPAPLNMGLTPSARAAPRR